MALYHVLKNGPQISEKHVGTSGSHRDESRTLRLDGIANRLEPPEMFSGDVYAATPEGTLASFDATTGRPNWRVKTGTKLSAGAGGDGGTNADDVADQVKQLRDESERLLREHRKGIMERQFQQKRLADAVSDIYAQIAVLSRVTAIFDEHGVEPSGQERYIAETFCTRAARRVKANLDQVEHNDDDRMAAIAKLAYKRGEYGYALFDD